MTSPAIDEEIVGLERAYWDAMKRKDGKRAAELSGDPSLVTGKQGVMSVARDQMGKMTETGEWTLDSYDFEEVKVARPTPDVAIVAYKVRQNVTMKGEPRSFRAADLSTWVKGPNGWACCAHSETVLDEGGGKG